MHLGKELSLNFKSKLDHVEVFMEVAAAKVEAAGFATAKVEAEDRPRARPGFVKPIQNGLRKMKNLFLHQSTAASTGWCGPRPRLGWVEMAVGLPEDPSYSGHSP